MRLLLMLLLFVTTGTIANASQYNCQEPDADTIKEFELLVGDQFLLVKKLENKQEVKSSGKLLEAKNAQKLFGGYEGFFAENESVILLNADVIAGNPQGLIIVESGFEDGFEAESYLCKKVSSTKAF